MDEEARVLEAELESQLLENRESMGEIQAALDEEPDEQEELLQVPPAPLPPQGSLSTRCVWLERTRSPDSESGCRKRVTWPFWTDWTKSQLNRGYFD